MEEQVNIKSQNGFAQQYPNSFILLINVSNIEKVKTELQKMGFTPAGNEGLKWMTEKKLEKLPNIVIHNNYIYPIDVLRDKELLKKWGEDTDRLLPIAHYTDLCQKYKEHKHEQKYRTFPYQLDYERTPDKCWEAIKKDGWNLACVPEELKTPDMCRLATQTCIEDKFNHNNTHIIKHIPFPEVCLEELKKMPLEKPNDIINTATFIRPEVMNDSIADYLVSSVKGASLKVIPTHLQTKERILEAVKVSGAFALLYNVRKDMLTPDIYMEAAKHSYGSFTYIPSEKLTPEICLEAAIRFPKELENNMIPRIIANGFNIYRLFKTVEYITKSSDFTTEQMRDLFSGKPLTVNGIQSEYGTFGGCVLICDRGKKELQCKPIQIQAHTNREHQNNQITKPAERRGGKKI